MKFKLRKKNCFRVDGRRVLFVDDSEKIDRVHRMLADSERIGCDTEFYGHRIRKESPVGKAKPVSMQLTCVGPKIGNEEEAAFIFIPNWGEYRGTIRHFRKWLFDSDRKKEFHNAKIDMHALENIGCPVRGLRSDSLVKAFVNFSAGDHGLKPLMDKHFEIVSPEYGEVCRVPVMKKDGTAGKKTRVATADEMVSGKLDWAFHGGSIRTLVEYAVKDPYYTVQLNEKLDELLSDTEWVKGKSMLEYYNQFEVEYTEVLYRMERRGCYVSPERLEELKERFEIAAVQYEKQFFRLCVKLGVSTRTIQTLSDKSKGKFGLIGSDKLIGELLQEHLGIELPQTAKDNASVSAASLHGIKSKKAKDLIAALLGWRSAKKKYLKTYVLPFMDIAECKEYKGRVHTTFNQAGANTGRLSSSNPNMLNLPARSEEGLLIRSAFVAEDPSMCMFDNDLSQIEVRLLAHSSQDPLLLKAYKDGLDIHSMAALEMFDEVKKWVGDRPISKELCKEIATEFEFFRKRSKNTIFMTIYGGGPNRYVAMNEGATKAEGKRVIDKFRKTYRGVQGDIDKTVRLARRTGEVRTLLRRHVHFPNINSYDHEKRGHAERAAFNAKIQGGCRDLIMMAMLLVDRDERLRDMGVAMQLQVYDELLFEAPRSEKAKKVYGPIVKEYMSHPYRHMGMKDLSIDTPADEGFGDSWAEAH